MLLNLPDIATADSLAGSGSTGLGFTGGGGILVISKHKINILRPGRQLVTIVCNWSTRNDFKYARSKTKQSKAKQKKFFEEGAGRSLYAQSVKRFESGSKLLMQCNDDYGRRREPLCPHQLNKRMCIKRLQFTL